MKKIKSFIVIIVTIFLLATSFVPVFALDTNVVPTTDPKPAEEIIADTDGPAFISVAAVSSSETQANIVWTTDELAYGYVQYGQTSSYGQATAKSADMALDHTVSITNLAAGTSYHYRIVAEDASGNISYSQDRILETAIKVVAVDNVPPEILQIDVTNVTESGATVHWVTNEVAQGKIEYGKTASYGSSVPFTSDYAAEHSVLLSNLSANTEYHFKITVADESSNQASSFDEIFTTHQVVAEPIESEPQPEEATPKASTPLFTILNVETSSLTQTSATIIWDSNELADAQVFYSQDESYSLFSSVSANSSASHQITLTDLIPAANYFYKVVSKNSKGQTISKSGFEFTTLAYQKITVAAPVISHVTVESIGTSGATIFFDTDKPATGIVNFGTTTDYQQTDGGHQALLTAHVHPLSGLTPNTLYNFEIVVSDALGNETIYKNVTFTTLASVVPVPTLPLIPTPIASTKPAVNLKPPVFTVPPKKPAGYHGVLVHIPKPVLTKVDPLDSQVLLLWQPISPDAGLSMVIVKDENRYLGPDLGNVIYFGDSGRFVDTDLSNNKTYYYSMYRVSQDGFYSSPLHIAVIPRKEKTQSNIIALPPVVQKSPIYVFSKILSRGDQNKHVDHLQILLASESSLYPEGLITGYFGKLTEKAVLLFQQKYGIPATGIADMATLKKLEQLSYIEVTSDKAMVYDKALTRDLTIGSEGKDVTILQQFLINANVYPEARLTGYFGPLTKSALQKFQQQQNIVPANGLFNQITKQRMLNLIRLRGVAF